ncbi:MAG TPA: sugar-binding protein [Acidobacteriota bacterium]|nr:sugar-binding protein [Acidobacteriota bacterium]
MKQKTTPRPVPIFLSGFICLFLSGLMTQAAFADAREIAIQPVIEKIRVDGILDEDDWRKAPSIANLTQVEPRSGEAPTESTRVWVVWSRDALYIAVRCEDGNARQIVATEMSRDATVSYNDNIEIILDTYHDHRSAYYFSTNASGAMVDGRITENQEASMEWDGIWNVRTNRDDGGWTAEFEIPFKSIGFDPGISTWGFNISRFVARNRETSRWASPSLDTRIYHVVRAGNITGIENPSQGIGLDIKPYGIIGFTRDIGRRNIVQPSGMIGEDVLQADYSGGLDIFYRITANIVSSTTINTDFAETEADTRQVNLTRFSLFFPEKRAFFLQDAGIFEFARVDSNGPPGSNMGGDLIPFFSRRIGLVAGYEVPLRIGQKLTGKIGRFDIGLLNVQTGRFTEPERTDRPELRLASRNLAVGRIKANFLGQSYVGAIFTNGDPTGQTSNQMGGIDLKLATSNFLNQNKNFSLMLFGSKTRTTDLKNRDTAYGGILSYPNDLVSLQYKWINIGENYNPALGFVPREGVRISALEAEISPRPGFWGIRQMSFDFAYQDYYNTKWGALESREIEVNPFKWRMESGEFIDYEWVRSEEQLFEPWTISRRNGIVLPAGMYKFNHHMFRFMSSHSRPFSVRTHFRTGSFFSGTRKLYSGEFTWRRNQHMTTAFTIQQNWIRLQEGDFNTSLLTYRLDYSFSPFITLANFVQYDTDSRNVGLQSRLRWILHPGNEFFVVLNHSWQEDNFNRFEANQTRFRVKMNYTFRF